MMGDLFDLTGKVAVITGNSKGIGRAIAERMAEHGAKIVVSSREKKPCETVAAAIIPKDGEAIVLPAHISHKDQLPSLVNDTLATWGGRNIRANYIAPGIIRTDFARALWEVPAALEKRMGGSPLPHIGEPDEIAGAAIFLASPAGKFTTGQTIVIDGGVTIAGAAVD